MNLYRKSIAIILANQAETGAYLASPNFPDYRYSWFRDGAFAAYAMDRAGQNDSARRFHDWAARTISRYSWKVAQLKAHGTIEAMQDPDRHLLHARYTAESEEVGLPWGNFQLDGLGAWLWALAEHLKASGQPHLPREWEGPAQDAADYLLLLWRKPCFDCWEEYGDHIHPSTLAAIYGGLHAINHFLHRHDITSALSAIGSFLMETKTPEGYFPKFTGTDEVDSSLIWLATPFDVLPPDDPSMKITVRKVVEDLRHGFGLRRYRWDTYFGGGLWIPTTAFYGWHLARLGRCEEAKDILGWIERQAGPDGSLPEQVNEHLASPEDHRRWVASHGPVASPLLWSHAMHIILTAALEPAAGRNSATLRNSATRRG